MSIECMEFKAHESGALKGFANFRVPKMGIELFGCSIFMKDGRRWMSLPSREYVDRETGDKKYISIMRFMEKEHNDSFCKAALHSMDQWCAANAQQQPQPSAPIAQPQAQQQYQPQAEEQEDLPF